VQVIERHIADHLLQNDIVLVRSVVLREIIPEYSHFLIRAAPTTFDVPESASTVLLNRIRNSNYNCCTHNAGLLKFSAKRL